MILTIAIPAPLFKTFDYLSQDTTDLLADDSNPSVKIEVGMRVEVPFSGRRLTGVVLKKTPQNELNSPTNYKLKAITKCLDTKASFSKKLIELISWGISLLLPSYRGVLSYCITNRAS